MDGTAFEKYVIKFLDYILLAKYYDITENITKNNLTKYDEKLNELWNKALNQKGVVNLPWTKRGAVPCPYLKGLVKQDKVFKEIKDSLIIERMMNDWMSSQGIVRESLIICGSKKKSCYIPSDMNVEEVFEGA